MQTGSNISVELVGSTTWLCSPLEIQTKHHSIKNLLEVFEFLQVNVSQFALPTFGFTTYSFTLSDLAEVSE